MFNKPQDYDKKNEFVKHKYLKENAVISKKYQLDIARKCLNANTSVILPTGLGKTIVGFLVMAEILPKKILFLAPTRPLVMQHFESCKRFLNINESEIVLLTGGVSAQKRASLINSSSVIVATPQTIKNDIVNNLYDLNSFALVIFDEMHKAVENYAYVEIAKKFNGLILGLTASPGSKKRKIRTILNNLKIVNIERRVRDDEDVINYIKNIEIEWIKITLDENIKNIRDKIHQLFIERLQKLNKLGILTYKHQKNISIKDILGARMSIMKRFGGSPYAFASYTNQAILLHAYHCLELVETQGIDSFLKYIDKFKDKKKLSRSEQMFLKSEHIKNAVETASKGKSISHPKLYALKDIVQNQIIEKHDSLILIFTQYRDTICSIEKMLNSIEGTRVNHFIGQANHANVKGMKQKEQKEIIDKFRKRELNVLIATSVAEEGIDIPDVNLVVFYEPVPSEIRGIQRKGRTGRTNFGKVKVLIARGTKDEAYLYAENHKENKMQWIVKGMGKKNKQIS